MKILPTPNKADGKMVDGKMVDESMAIMGEAFGLSEREQGNAYNTYEYERTKQPRAGYRETRNISSSHLCGSELFQSCETKFGRGCSSCQDEQKH